MKTILIHNGASKVGIEKIRELLSENNYTTNELKIVFYVLTLPTRYIVFKNF